VSLYIWCLGRAAADITLPLPDRLFVVQEAFDTSIDLGRLSFSKKDLKEKYAYQTDVRYGSTFSPISFIQINPASNMGTPDFECFTLLGDTWN
jgi:hypothetical protein